MTFFIQKGNIPTFWRSLETSWNKKNLLVIFSVEAENLVQRKRQPSFYLCHLKSLGWLGSYSCLLTSGARDQTGRHFTCRCRDQWASVGSWDTGCIWGRNNGEGTRLNVMQVLLGSFIQRVVPETSAESGEEKRKARKMARKSPNERVFSPQEEWDLGLVCDLGKYRAFPFQRHWCWELSQTSVMCFCLLYGDSLIAIPGHWCLRKHLWTKVTVASEKSPDAEGTSGSGPSRASVLFQVPHSSMPAPLVKLIFTGLEYPVQYRQVQITSDIPDRIVVWKTNDLAVEESGQ